MEDVGLLDTVAQGDVPALCLIPAQTLLLPATSQKVDFLAPLDNVIWDRARLASLFDFDYVWEVCKPADARRWGYYTLPILYEDKLVGRIAPRLSRKTNVLHIEGFWLEDDRMAQKGAFRRALAAGLARFARFHQAARINASALANPDAAACVMLSGIVAEYAA